MFEIKLKNSHYAGFNEICECDICNSIYEIKFFIVSLKVLFKQCSYLSYRFS